MWLLLTGLALAEEYWVEVAPFLERADAAAFEVTADKAGFEARVVRRFQLGEGWEYVVLLEHLPSEDAAVSAAEKLGTDPTLQLSVLRVDDGKKSKPAHVTVPANAPSMSPRQWLDQAEAAHGGPSGGAMRLASAEVVHFVFERTIQDGNKTLVVRHDYWRQGGLRRVSVTPTGGGKASVLVANTAGAWIAAEGKVEARDIGVLLNAADALAPEAVLAIALDLPHLFDGPEVDGFAFLEGAESGVRIGRGTDSDEPALSFVDLDPATGRLIRARYVTESGPILFEMDGYQELAPGVIVPTTTTVRRANGSVETVVVKSLTLLDAAPAATFDKPSP